MRDTVPSTDEHEQSNGKSESSKLLRSKSGHQFDWMILSRAPSHRLKQKILGVYFIKQLNPSFNDQFDNNMKRLTLFRHDVT